MTHALEMLESKDGVDVSYSTFRRWCHEKGFVKRRKRRKGIARQRRDRMPNEGLLIQMDGSPHEWNGRDKWSLISTIDDATSKVPYAEFFDTENTLGSMTVLRGLIERCGLPFALYVDKANCFGGVPKARYNQFKRACKELDIKVISANSPEAKGRVERGFDTFQDRIIPELRIYGIKKMDKANEYLREKFLPNYWDRRLTVEPRNPESKYRPLPKDVDLKEILCLKYQRTVNGDHTVTWDSKTWQLDWPRERPIRGHQIEFRVYLDGTWKAFHVNDPVAVRPVLKPIKVTEATKKADSAGLIPRSLHIPPGVEFRGHNLRYDNE